MFKYILLTKIQYIRKEKQKRKTLILIAVRDYGGRIPFKILRQNLYNNIKEIWNGLDKV